MARVTTLPAVYRPLMGLPTLRLARCAVCGRAWPLNQHHAVWRSWGEVWEGGRRLPKPTVTLCGSGNASGCHGLAHHMRLHFRAGDAGQWQYLVTDEPTRYERALEMDGWRDLDAVE